MKKYLFLLIMGVIQFSVFSQSNFCSGFKDGYVAGYKDGNKLALDPLTPLCPICKINESESNYQDGYDRGFKVGLKNKPDSPYGNNSNPSQGNGLINGLAVRFPADKQIEDLRYQEQMNRQANIDAQNKAKMYEHDFQYTNVLNSFDNQRIKAFASFQIKVIGKFVNENPDWEINVNKRMQYNQLVSKLKDNSELERGLVSDEGMKSYLKDLTEKNMNPETFNKEGFDQVAKEWANYQKFGNQAGEEALNKEGTKAFVYSPPHQKDEIDYTIQGHAKYKSQDYQGAIADYSKAIKINPQYANAYLNRALAKNNLVDYKGALTDFDKAIEIEPNNTFAYGSRAWMKFYLKDNMGALADFNKQIESEPNSSNAYLGRGSVKSALGDQSGAIGDYSKAIELEPDFSMAFNNRGWAKYELKKYSEALIDLNKAIEIDPTNSVAFDSRQEIKFELNDLKGCIEDCNTAISLDSKTSNSYLIRGRAYYKQSNKTKACEDWSKAGELGLGKAYDLIKKYCK